ncbi:DUF882 domain-containing protein [Methylocystis parvus]|uniref:DUF882 domain-containing protein n=1 Tax=Methylocystis parvus TaxID=134 RepID=UPI00036483F4
MGSSYKTGSKPDGEAILLTTPRDSEKRKPASPLSLALGLLAGAFATLSPSITETAIANGDTRTIYLHHAHTGEDIAATYLVSGQYDSHVLQQLNWFLRDWRRDEPTNMDPRLFDVVWEAYRSAGAGNQVINVVSAYRSPETNAMLRARSRAVAKYSQHMLGKAMDTTMPGMPMSNIREIGMRMQRGGVGYYPTANTPFVHLDVGNVRSWPRMTYDQLVRLFPDGKTVHLPTNGQPLPGYEEARAEIEARGNGAYVTAPRRTFGGFFAALFGMGGGEDEDAEIAAPPPSTRKQWAALAPRNSRNAQADSEGGEEGAVEQPTSRRARNQIARAEADLPRGETAMTATGAVAVAPPSVRAPQTAAPPAEDGAEAPPEETKRPKYARVPLPPSGRPAIEKPTPLTERSAEVASAEPGTAQELRSSVDDAQENLAEATAARRFVKAPTPPRRPSFLAAAASRQDDAPTPPERPQVGTASHAIAHAVDAPEEQQGKDDAALAYAPHGGVRTAAPQPDENDGGAARKSAGGSDLAPARLDRSNFNTLTAATPTARASARSVLGAPITAVRSAARASEPSVLLPPTRPAHLVGFAAPALPPTDKFSSPALHPRQKIDGDQKK